MPVQFKDHDNLPKSDHRCIPQTEKGHHRSSGPVASSGSQGSSHQLTRGIFNRHKWGLFGRHSQGRFGKNLITGWQRPEYAQMGLWPGDQFFATRYDYLAEYTTILRELCATGRSDLKGKYFQMEDCRMLPTPQTDINSSARD